MKELKIGIITNTELADWFGITLSTFSHNKKNKLKELENFAEFEITSSGKIDIKTILEPIYSKKGNLTYKKVVNHIDEVWSKNGLDSCSRVGTEINRLLREEDKTFLKQDSTIIKYTLKGRNELYGVPYSTQPGTLGSCIYIWCKKREDGTYDFLNEEEKAIKEFLQKKYFGDATEKQIIVSAMVAKGEIEEKDAWGVLTQLTNMQGVNFLTFLDELQRKIGCQVVRGTWINKKPQIEESAFNWEDAEAS